MPDHIFLDIDGVLADFNRHALEWVGCDVPEVDYHKPEWGFDVVKAANAHHPTRSFSPAQFWETISRKCWETTPKTPEFDFIIDSCLELVGKESICLLTAPTLDPQCAAGKVTWIKENCPRFLHRQYLIGPKKHWCAKPGALLIDDADHNVDAFRQHGSSAWCVPRPWNALHFADPVRHLKANFEAQHGQDQTA